MKCPKCENEMVDLGHIGGLIISTKPPTIETTHVCHHCSIRKRVERVEFGHLLEYLQKQVEEYEEIK